MGYLTNSLMLLFCISFALYLMGYQSGAQMLLGNWFGGEGIQSTTSASNFIWNVLTVLGVAAGVGIAAGILTGGNFGVIYSIPVAMLATILVFTLAPLSFINEATFPMVLKILLTGFFTITILGGVLNFIRGGDA